MVSRTAPEIGSRAVGRTLAIYAGLVVIPAVFGIVIAFIAAGSVSGSAAAVDEPAGQIPTLSRLLFAIAFVCMAGVAGSWLAKLLRQPQAVGQMIAGLAIGPSLLGRFAPEFSAWLFPAGTAQILALFGGVGAIFFIFLVGLDFSWPELRRSGLSTVLLGQATMAIPFLGGAILAVGLSRLGEAPAHDPMAFNLFIAVAMSVTALPVLAHILRERGLDQSPLGAVGIAAAAICDATAWCVLAVTLAIAGSGSASGALLAMAGVALFAVAMWFLARPAWARLDSRAAPGSTTPLLALLGMLVAALVTDSLGAHAIFGAFLAGLIFPRSANYRTINSKIEGVVEWFLLPMFFVSTGLQTKIGLLDSGHDVLILLVVLGTAIASKSLATALLARLVGYGWRSTAQLAAMMNCRGITELIVLNIGLHAGLLNQKLFTVLTVVTIITTMITGPALDLIGRLNGRDQADSGRTGP